MNSTASQERFLHEEIGYEEILRLKLDILERVKGGQIDLSRAIKEVVGDLGRSTREKIAVCRKLELEIRGYGVIQEYLDDPGVSEIMINGLGSFFIEKNGVIEAKRPCFESASHLDQLIYRIASEVGREINTAHPILDARLRDGSRVNIVLSPVAIGGPIVTIRKFNASFSGDREIVGTGMLTPDLARFLKLCVASRYNMFLCGGTGSGKTTLLNYLCRSISPRERVVTIEDAAEIDIADHGHVISLETRNTANREFAVDMSRLIKNALRMRPDRIIVGEVRGEEVIDMLQAMNTGHDGSISTGHSNSALDMLVRLEVIAASYSEIDHLLIRRQIISAIDLMVFIERFIDGRRVISGVYEVEKNTDDYRLRTLYRFGDDARTSDSELLERLQNKGKIERCRAGSREAPV